MPNYALGDADSQYFATNESRVVSNENTLW